MTGNLLTTTATRGGRRGLRMAGRLLLIAALAAAGSLGWLLLRTVPAPDFLARKGSLEAVEETGVVRLDDSRIVEIALTSSSGLKAQLALRLPHHPLPERPLVFLLAGQETGRAAVELIPDTRGVAVAALSYPFGAIPHRDGLALTLALARIQKGIMDTPSLVMLAMDYLMTRPEVNPERVELAGVSFGAYLAAIPAVLDQRIDRLWLIHGSGDPESVFEAGLSERIPLEPLRRAVAWTLATVAAAHHLSPEHWVARVPPRPLVVINATEDSALPDSAVRVLHGALHSPYEILWTPGDHVHPKRPEMMHLIAELIFERVSAGGGAGRL